MQDRVRSRRLTSQVRFLSSRFLPSKSTLGRLQSGHPSRLNVNPYQAFNAWPKPSTCMRACTASTSWPSSARSCVPAFAILDVVAQAAPRRGSPAPRRPRSRRAGRPSSARRAFRARAQRQRKALLHQHAAQALAAPRRTHQHAQFADVRATTTALRCTIAVQPTSVPPSRATRLRTPALRQALIQAAITLGWLMSRRRNSRSCAGSDCDEGADGGSVVAASSSAIVDAGAAAA